MASPVTTKKRIHWYFTWNSLQKNYGKYTVIFGDYYEARRKMVACWGDNWGNQYPSAEKAGVEEFGFEEVITPGGKKPIVNAGNKWTVTEDQRLMCSMQNTIRRIAKKHNRTEKAIVERLKILYAKPELLQGKRLHSYVE